MLFLLASHLQFDQGKKIPLLEIFVRCPPTSRTSPVSQKAIVLATTNLATSPLSGLTNCLSFSRTAFWTTVSLSACLISLLSITTIGQSTSRLMLAGLKLEFQLRRQSPKRKAVDQKEAPLKHRHQPAPPSQP